MLLYNYSSTALDFFATIASVIIAAFAILQFSYLVFIQAKKEKQRNEKEWFHRLVIEPKINEVYDFFERTEIEIEKIKNLLESGFTYDKALEIAKNFKTSIFKFRRSFVDLLYPIDSNLSSKIQNAADNLLDFYSEKLFSESESFDDKDLKDIHNKFYSVQSKIISLLYRWKN
jgi:hypothetical protein